MDVEISPSKNTPNYEIDTLKTRRTNSRLEREKFMASGVTAHVRVDCRTSALRSAATGTVSRSTWRAHPMQDRTNSMKGILEPGSSRNYRCWKQFSFYFWSRLFWRSFILELGDCIESRGVCQCSFLALSLSAGSTMGTRG